MKTSPKLSPEYAALIKANIQMRYRLTAVIRGYPIWMAAIYAWWKTSVRP